MADMLKITQMVNAKNYSMPSKPLAQSDAIFNLADLSKIPKTNDRTSEFRGQDNASAEGKSNSLLDIQLNISKNPTFTANLLKGLFSEEILTQISQSGSPDIINEFNEFSKNIFLNSNALTNDLISQQKGITSFDGELFNLLREIVNQSSSPELKNAIAGFLKSSFSLEAQGQILKSLSAQFQYLSEAMLPSRSLSGQLAEISKLLSEGDASVNFENVKADALKLLESVSNSLIATDKIKNMISLVKYNFSRFNDNPQTVEASFKALLGSISNDELKAVLREFYDKYIQSGKIPNPSKSALVSDSERFLAADKLAYKLAENANEQIKLFNYTKFNSDIHTVSQQLSLFNDKNGEMTNLSLDQGTRFLSDVLKLVLPQNMGGDIKQFIDTFMQTKDLNALIDRLSFILNSIENPDVKAKLAEILNSVLTGLSRSSDIVYRPPTSMENLADFLTKALNNQNISHLGIVDPNTLVQSMLTAPGVFTPLLHYLLPVQIEDLRAFGELWIDNDDSGNSSDDEENSHHIFLSFDIEHIGIFELEVFQKNSSLDVSLFCPKNYVKQFSAIKDRISEIAGQSGYNIKTTRVKPLVKVRNLVEIFPRIAERRAGLNVKI